MGSCCIKKMCVWTQSGRYQQPNASAIDWTPEICVLALSQWRDVALILLKFSHSPTFSVSLSPLFSLLFLILSLCSSIPFLHFFHTSFVSFNPPFPVSLFTQLLVGSLICLPSLSLPPFSTDQQPHRACSDCTIASVFSPACFLPLRDLGSIQPLEWWPTLNPYK